MVSDRGLFDIGTFDTALFDDPNAPAAILFPTSISVTVSELNKSVVTPSELNKSSVTKSELHSSTVTTAEG